jgi:hypothetical protein
MRNSLLFIALSILFISFSCKKLNIKKELRIDLGTHFQNDFVTIKLDDHVVFSETVSTNPVLGVAKVVNLNYPIGKYEISVTVNGKEKTDKVRHQKNRYIYISYDAASEIQITFAKERYFYE